VALIGTDVSEECITSSIRVERISELGIMLAVTSSSETWVQTRATLHHIPDDSIIQSHIFLLRSLFGILYDGAAQKDAYHFTLQCFSSIIQ
jgi:hypothetical protein